VAAAVEVYGRTRMRSAAVAAAGLGGMALCFGSEGQWTLGVWGWSWCFAEVAENMDYVSGLVVFWGLARWHVQTQLN
jgi:hypothetical protein